MFLSNGRILQNVCIYTRLARDGTLGVMASYNGSLDLLQNDTVAEDERNGRIFL